MREYVLRLDGMACPMCETHVNDIAYKTGTVKKAKSSYRKGILLIKTEYDDIESLKSSLEKAGYRVLSVEEK